MSLAYENVSFQYRRSRPDVVDRLTWSPHPGRTALLGPNGAGKSTVLALGAGTLRPRLGRVRPSGRNARSHIGWMPQEIRPVGALRAREQVAYAGWLRGMPRSTAWSGAGRALDRVGLGARADVRTSELSGGQLRRLGLAEALVADPRVLLLDEPTAGLDPEQRGRFREALRELAPSCTVVVSTHQVDDLQGLFDRVVVLVAGRIAFDGPVTAFLAISSEGSELLRAEEAYRRILGEGS